jgi:hypothetical protein
MNTNTAFTNSIAGLVIGLVSTLGVSGTASAASDYKVIADQKIQMGDWDHHNAFEVVRFHLPESFDAHKQVVLQMNIRSTNKSQYNAIYLASGITDDFEGCDSIGHDRNEQARVDFLPKSSHKQWSAYHKVVEGQHLQPGDNYLLICARNKYGESDYELDNFYVKDIVLHYREEKPAPQFCPSVFEPVCGVDGYTYSSTCEADSARVEIQHEGRCNGL